jgi:hypothetical protein
MATDENQIYTDKSGQNFFDFHLCASEFSSVAKKIAPY